jgi:LAS superfamily LD-carboxypeptidase LdcB
MSRKSACLMALVTTLAALLTVLGAAQSSTVRVESTSIRVGPRVDDARHDFMRRVHDAQVKRAQGRPIFANLRDDQLGTVGGGHKMRKNAAEQCKLLLKEANSDLRRQKQEGNQEALKVSGVGVYSAYRSVEHDTAAWRSAFKKHLKATADERAKLKGGEYGGEAVEMMVRIMRKFKAAPGFSRHTSGVAVDFKTTEDKVTLTANSNQNRQWKKTWFHKWLVKNAVRFKFKPLATEAWHWEYAK